MTNKNTPEGSFWGNVSRDQAKDSGMAAVLILLILGMVLKESNFYTYALIALVVNMILPVLYKPFAVVWFALATFMGNIMSRVFLTIVYILLVLPVGLIRRMAGKDPLQLKQFKKGLSSVFKERNYRFQATDIEDPY